MLRKRYILSISLLLIFTVMSAQKVERDFIRKGNRAYRDSLFVDADVNYRKALEENTGSAVSMYNLGSALTNQQKLKEAMEQYQMAAKIEKDKMKLSKIYHNAGVLYQVTKDYAKAIDVYKQSLRNNPKDDETRYNLALCQKLLQEQQQNPDQNQDKQDQQDQQDQKNQDKQNQDQQNKDQQDKEQEQQEQKENEMSKENAEQMLNSVMQDEKDVQEKVQKQQQILQGGKLDKNW